MLSKIRRYRNTVAEILVLGSILKKLEGEELNRLERWREAERTEDNGGSASGEGQRAIGNGNAFGKGEKGWTAWRTTRGEG
jgi:cell division protein FtsW (lipid II flippase)